MKLSKPQPLVADMRGSSVGKPNSREKAPANFVAACAPTTTTKNNGSKKDDEAVVAVVDFASEMRDTVLSLGTAIDFLCEETTNICNGNNIGADLIPPLRDTIQYHIAAAATTSTTKTSLSHPFFIEQLKAQQAKLEREMAGVTIKQNAAQQKPSTLLPYMKKVYEVRFGNRRWDHDILNTLLNMAIILGDDQLVMWLIQEPNMQATPTSQQMLNAMLTASFFGRVQIMDTLHSQLGCPVEGCEHYSLDRGMTPIHLAACGNQINVVKYLVEQHAVEVHHLDDTKNGASNSSIADLLASSSNHHHHSTGTSEAEGTGDDPSKEVTRRKKSNSLKNGVKKNGAITTSSSDEEKVWDLSSYYSRLSNYVKGVLEKEDLTCLSNLLDKFPTIIMEDAVMYALKTCNAEMMQLLLDKGYAVEDAMLHALQDCNSQMVQVLLDKGYPLEAPLTQVGDTALLLAVQQQDVVSARLLLEAGADVDCTDQDGFRCIHLAAEKNDWDMATLLIQQHEASVNVHTIDGATPIMLHLSSGVPTLKMLQLLVEEGGADINESRSPIFTPLHAAAYSGYTEIAKYLVQEAGAELERRSYEGFTPLLYACEQGHLDTVKMLITNGANVNARHPSGRTTLTHTCVHGHEDIVRLLLHNDVDLDASVLNEAVTTVSSSSTTIERSEGIVNCLKEYSARH